MSLRPALFALLLCLTLPGLTPSRVSAQAVALPADLRAFPGWQSSYYPEGLCVATKGNSLTGGLYTNNSSTGRTWKVKHFFPSACGAIKLGYRNTYALTYGENPAPNGLWVGAALVKSDGTVLQATFGGQSLVYLPGATPVATPAAPTLTAGTSGSLTASSIYFVALTYTNPAGETVIGTPASVTVGATTPSVTVTPPPPVTGATGYRVYLGLAGGTSAGPFYLAATRGLGEAAVLTANVSALLSGPPAVDSTASKTAAVVYTDPIPAELSAGDYAYSITWANTVTTGLGIPVGTVTYGGSLVTGEGYSNGNYLANPGGLSTSTDSSAYSPSVIVGLTDSSAARSVAIVGDSIADGTGDLTIGPGDPGFIARALGNSFGYVRLTKGGELSTDFQNLPGTGTQRNITRILLAARCTDAVEEYGTNDLVTVGTLAALKARKLLVWAMLHRRGCAVFCCTLTPRARSLDQWHTPGPGNGTTTGQWGYDFGAAYAAGTSTPETIRQGYNQWLRAPASAGAGSSALFDAGGTLAGVFDSGATGEANADGSAITINAATGAISNGSGGYWKTSGAVSVSSTATATGTTTTLVDTSQAWTVNQYQGAMLYFASGTGAGNLVEIKSNTATTLTFNVTQGFSPDTTTHYAIYQGWTIDGIHPTLPQHVIMATAINTAKF